MLTNYNQFIKRRFGNQSKLSHSRNNSFGNTSNNLLIGKKFLKNKVNKNFVNKRTRLSQILSESVKLEKMLKIQKLKKVMSSKNINLEEKNQNLINDNENKEEKEINSKTIEYIKIKKIKLSSNKLDKNNNTLIKSKEKTEKIYQNDYF